LKGNIYEAEMRVFLSCWLLADRGYMTPQSKGIKCCSVCIK